MFLIDPTHADGVTRGGGMLPVRLRMISLILLAACMPVLDGCSTPDDDRPAVIIGPTWCRDEWRDDTAQVRTTIRFEALLDTSRVPFTRFAGSGLRVAVVCLPPDSGNLPYRDIYSVSANYLDIPAAGLPFSADIPREYFRQYSCSRLAAAIILVYRDTNTSGRYEYGEPVFGASEQSLYAFVDGDINTVPRDPFESVFGGSNVLIRYRTGQRSRFQSSPDYLATIFIINVRGEGEPYDIPYPWSVAAALFPRSARS